MCITLHNISYVIYVSAISIWNNRTNRFTETAQANMFKIQPGYVALP